MLLHRFKNKILLCILIIFYSISNLCFANTLETQLSHDQVMLNDSVFITYILNNNTINRPPDFSVLHKDFRILNTNYGNAINMVNGMPSMQTFWRLQLKPKRAGDLIIPEINFGNNKSTSLKLMVTTSQIIQNAQTTIVSAQQNGPVFVRGEINTAAPYVQSQVLYTFKLYFRIPLREPRIQIPQIKNVTFLQLGDRPEYQTTINGKVYNVAEKIFAIFPKKPGAITIPPLQFNAFTVDENISIFDNPFNFDEPKAVSVATKDIKFSVRNVPLNYPDTVWLPAKNISLTEQWSDNSGHGESGTPVTRTITIKAQGLRADQLPDISIDKINGVNIYADRPKRSNHIQNDMVGILEQKVTYIPNTTRSFTIPPIKINWWNTQTNSDAIAQLGEMNVKVKGVVGMSNPPANIALTPALSPPNIAPATTQETKIILNAFYTSIWFWVACALLAAWIVTLWSMLRNKPVITKNSSVQTHTSTEASDKNFEQACRAGQTMQVQQYLLSWIKKQRPNIVLNLATLRELIHDEPFQLAIQELEEALYARKSSTWNGQTLLTAFQRIKKTRKYLDALDINFNKRLQVPTDPLPPLNPSHN